MPGQLRAAILANQAEMAVAATRAMERTRDLAVSLARDNISAAGFSRRWQAALKGTVFPVGETSISPVAVIKLRIPYASIFEDGGTITGKPLLWLPLPTVPIGAGGRPMTPREYISSRGPLISIKNARRPILAAITRRGAKPVFLYVGMTSVEMHKLLDIHGSVDRAAERLPEFYLESIAN